MLEEVLTEDLVETHYKAVDRDDAVREAGRLLVKRGVAKEEYIEAMIENVKVNGTYIVIAPGIAMPHARPEKGARGIGFALVSRGCGHFLGPLGHIAQGPSVLVRTQPAQ